MPVIYQHRIYRSDLVANPSAIYLFGDNEERIGLGGQAAMMRGEPNAVGVCTKATPGARNEFWSDDRLTENCAIIDADLARAFAHAKEGGNIVIPSDGLGTGLAQLGTKAPKTFKYLAEQLSKLERA